MKQLEEDQIQQNDKLAKTQRERANLEQRLNELQSSLSGEEGRAKALEKSKQKYEQTIAELDERLKRAGIDVFLLVKYVDDCNLATSIIP